MAVLNGEMLQIQAEKVKQLEEGANVNEPEHEGGMESDGKSIARSIPEKEKCQQWLKKSDEHNNYPRNNESDLSSSFAKLLARNAGGGDLQKFDGSPKQ